MTVTTISKNGLIAGQLVCRLCNIIWAKINNDNIASDGVKTPTQLNPIDSDQHG